MAERPCCLNCGKILKPSIRRIYAKITTSTGYHFDAVARAWDGSYDSVNGIFCNTGCAAEFAVGVARLWFKDASASPTAIARQRIPRIVETRALTKQIEEQDERDRLFGTDDR